MKIARMIKRKSVKHVRIFSLSIDMMRDEKIKFFKKNDFVTLVQALRTSFKVKVYTIYKRKNQKIKFSDICVFDDFKSNDDASWKKNIIKKKNTSRISSINLLSFFISKFFELTKEARWKFERIQRMQIKNELLKRKKEFLLEMLFNREIALFWNFIEKDSIRFEISSFMKIRTISHEAWQVFEFQVFKALMKTIAEMIKNRIKNEMLKLCYEFYRNSWFLVKKKKKKVLFDQCHFENESSHHSRYELVFCDWQIFWKVCWLCNDLVCESVLWIRLIIVDRKMSRYDRLYDVVWFNENDNDFHESD
jgi:hypothetical protein